MIDKKVSEVLKRMNLFCTIVIVLGHSYNLINFSTQNNVISFIEYFISYAIGGVGVPYFFIQSSLFLYSKERDAKTVYKSRFKSLVVPYLAWNIIYTIFYTIMNVFGIGASGMKVFNLKSVLRAVFLHGSNTTFWFMYQLILFTALYPLINFLRKHKKWFYGCYILFFVIYLWKGEIFGWTDVSSVFISLRRLLEYGFGIIIVDNIHIFSKVFKYIKKNFLMVVLLLFGCIGTYILYTLNKNNMILEKTEGLVNLVFLFVMFIVLYNKDSGTDTFIFKTTFLIYAMHPAIIISLRNFASVILPNKDIWIITCYLCSPAIAIGVVLCLIVIVKKLCPKLLFMLNGFRTI